MTSVGRWTCSMVQAMVADFPEPVMPSSVWNRSPRSTPSAKAAIADGWSPAGWKSDTTLNGGTCLRLATGCDKNSRLQDDCHPGVHHDRGPVDVGGVVREQEPDDSGDLHGVGHPVQGDAVLHHLAG